MTSIADYEAWKAQIQKQNAAAAGVAVSTAEGKPDDVAGKLNLATEFGKVTGNPVPPLSMVQEYHSTFQQEIDRRKSETILTSSPRLAEWVRNPENAVLAKDDLGALSVWDRMSKALKLGDATATVQGKEFTRDAEAVVERSAFGRGFQAVGDAFDDAIMTNSDGTPNFLGRLANYARNQGMAGDGIPRQLVGGPDVTAEDRAKAMFAQNLGPLYSGAKAVLSQMEKEGFKPMSYKDVNGVGSALSFIGENLAMSAPQMVATMSSGAFSPLVSIIGMGGEVNNELSERVKDMTPEQRVAVSAGAGTVMAALDYMGLAKIFGGAGVGQVASDAVAGTLAEKIIANGGSKALGAVLTAAITEGTTEAMQEAITMGVTSLSGGDYKAGEVMDRLAQSFFAGAGAGGGIRGGLETSGAAGRRFIKDREKIDGVEDTQAKIQEVAQNAVASKLRERMPDRFRQFVGQALDGTEAENMYMPADQFVGYFQNMGIDPFEMADALEGVSRDDLDAALAGGGNVKIPTATYAAHIAGTEHDGFFAENLKFDPNAFTSEEARLANARIDELTQAMWEEAEAARVESDRWRTFEQEMTDDMISRLRIAGQSTDVAVTNAATVVAAFQTEAQRAGLTVDEFLRLWQLPEVQGAIPQGMQFKDVDALTRTLAAARNRRGGPAADKRQSLLEFIDGHGGINDPGGELKARDAVTIKRGRGKKTLKLARDTSGEGQASMLGVSSGGKRHGVDDVAQAAIEAGFMADHPDVMAYKAALESGDQVPDITRALWEAIDDELRGQRQTSEQEAAPDNSQDAALDDMEAYLHRLGLTLDDDDAAIRSAVEADQAEAARQYAQGGETVDVDGVELPLNADGTVTLYHGTTKSGAAGIVRSKVLKADAEPSVYLTTAQQSDGTGYGDGTVVAIDIMPDQLRIDDEFPDGRADFAIDEPRVRVVRARIMGAAYEQRNETGPRGLIQFGADGQSVIRMFEAANLSTFQHEAGHLFLSIKQDLEQRGFEHAAADMKIVREWWKANAADVARDGMNAMPDVVLSGDDVAAWTDNGTTGDLMKDAALDIGGQEQFARGFEAYLMEGKAPSVELKTVFSKMAAWMVSVYKRLRNLNVNVTDDIRGVMDRMLATDEQIARARQETGDGGMVFATAEQMGLTQEEFDRLMKLRDQTEADARGRLLSEIMEPIRREREQWFKDEKAKVKAAVTADFQARPVFRAVQELRFGKGFDGADVTVPKLDRTAIDRDYGAGYVPLLPGATKDGKGHRNAVFASEGAHPDVVAGIYGFPSGRDLLDALTQAPPISEAINAETDKVMREFHGDALNDGDIEVIALDAVHSERRTEWLAAELKAISEVAGVEVGMTAKEARLVARDTLDRATVKDAMSSHRYLAAERKAANEAQDLARALGREGVWMQNARRRVATKTRAALRDDATVDAVARQAEQADASTGNYNETVQKFIAAKQRQLMNHALYMESRKTREFVEKIEDKTRKLNVSDEKLGKSRDINYAKAARNLAAKFGLARGDSEFDVQAWFDQLQFDDPVKATALQDAIATYGRDAKPYKDMILSELGALNDAIDGFLELGKQAKNIEIEGKLVDKAQAIDDLNAVLEGRGLKRNPALDRELSKGEKRVRTIMGWASALRRVEGWARAMDDSGQGVYTRYLVRPVMDALDAYRVDKTEKLAEMLAILDARRDTLTGAAITAPELNGYTFTNKAALLHAILHTGNASNMAKLLLGRGWSQGFVRQQQATTSLGRPRFRRDGSPVMTKGDLDTSQWEAFLDRMIDQGVITSEDIATVNAIWDLMEKTKRPAQAAHKKMFGFYFKEIEAAGYDTKAGRLKGGYVPAVLDRDASNDGMLREGEAAIDQQAAGFMLPTAGRGFTKSRVENYQQPLALDLTLLPAHMDKVLRFTHLDPSVRQVHGLIVDRRFGETLAKYDRTLIDNMLLPWLQRVAQQSVDAPASSSAGRSMNAVLTGLRKRVGFNTMFANLVNVTQQFTGLSVAATIIKGSHLKDATARFARDMSASRQEVFDLSPFMRERIKNATRETQMRIQDVVKEPSTYNDFQKWVDRHGYFMQQAVQNWIDVPVWMAAFDQAVAKGMTESDAVFEADAAIRRTMVGMNPEDVSMFESGPAWKRLFTMFYTYFNGQANHIAEQGSVIWRQNGWGGSGKLFILYLLGVMVPAVGAEIISQAARGGLGDEDDDGSYWDDVLSLFFGSQLKYGTAMVPVGGQLTQLVFNQFNDQVYDDRLSPSPAISTLDRAARSPRSVYRAVTGEGSAQVAVGDGITAFALATGLPLNWLAKPLGYAAGVAEGRNAPEGPVDILQGAITGRDGTGKK